MNHDYTFYQTEDWIDWYSRSVLETTEHGISVNLDKDDNILSWSGYGDYYNEVNKCETIEQLRDFVKAHLGDVEEYDSTMPYTNEEMIDELVYFLDQNCKKCA